jgi:hypothetical protein
MNKSEDQFEPKEEAPDLNSAINSYIKAVHDYAQTSNKALDTLSKYYSKD